MVAVCPANPTPDVRLPSAFGSLLLAPWEIEHPRWRLYAWVRIGPAFHRCGVPLDRLRRPVEEDLRAAVCPAPLREPLQRSVLDHLAHDRVAALAVAALWTRDWPGAALRAAAAALAAREPAAARSLAAGRGASAQLHALVRDGCLDGRFIGDVRDAGAYEPSVALVRALADARSLAAGRGAPAQRGAHAPSAALVAARAAAAVAARLPARERDRAVAHLARLALHTHGIAAARTAVRSLATASGRSAASLWLARELIAARRFDDAEAIGDAIESPVLRQYARIELACGHLERGAYADALVALRAVTAPNLATVRRAIHRRVLALTRDPSRRFRWPDAEPRAWDPAPWLCALDPVREQQLTAALIQTRFGGQRGDYAMLEAAVRKLAAYADDPGARRRFVQLLAQTDAPSGVLPVMCRLAPGFDAYAAEDIGLRAQLLQASQPFRAGLAGAAPPSTDSSSLSRALYDEGLALSTHAPRRRRVLIATAQYCLRSALGEPDAWSRRVIEVRLRTLVHLGGQLAGDAIAKAVATLPFHRRLTPLALSHLIALDPRRAAALVFARLVELDAAGPTPLYLLHELQIRGALPAGFARAYAAALAHGPSSRVRVRERDLIARIAALYAHTGEMPSPVVVERLASVDPARTPIAALIERITRARGALGAHADHVAVLRQIGARPELIDDLAICEPPRVDPAMRPWSPALTRRLVARASDKCVGEVVPGLVARVARRLAPAVLEPVQAFEIAGVRYRVRSLDKRLDLLTYLRFADVPARSCYRSDGGLDYYGRTRDHVLAAWRDPLTVCFHVERERQRTFQPCGFLLGSFADVDGELGLVFNSLHVRPASAAVREQVLRAVERMAAPFGIAQLGIANLHGGCGALPSDYVPREAEITRYRALAVGGELVVDVHDDIGGANVRTRLRHLHWRSLSGPPARQAVLRTR